jgi:hypothetical protein
VLYHLYFTEDVTMSLLAHSLIGVARVVGSRTWLGNVPKLAANLHNKNNLL